MEIGVVLNGIEVGAYGEDSSHLKYLCSVLAKIHTIALLNSPLGAINI